MKSMNSNFNLDERISDLIIRYLTDDISPDELKELYLWINESVENKEIFNDLKNSWLLTGQVNESENFDSNRSLKALDAKIRKTSERNFRTAVFLPLRKYAAIGLLCMIAGGILAWLIKPSLHSYNQIATVVSAPLGAKGNVILPDGTKVWLNAGSKIEYEPDFGKDTRTIQLTGEAYFDVTKNKKKPFFVKTAHMVVKAVGTRFNVKAYPEEKTITATLEEGSIEVETPMNGSSKLQRIVLQPNEKITYYKPVLTSNMQNTSESVKRKKQERSSADKNLVLARNVKTILYTSWKDKRWILEGEPLGSLGTIMERRYNIVVRFDQPEIGKYKFTGTIENETLDQILSAFRLTAPIDYKINKDTVSFTLNKKLKEKYSRITEY